MALKWVKVVAICAAALGACGGGDDTTSPRSTSPTETSTSATNDAPVTTSAPVTTATAPTSAPTTAKPTTEPTTPPTSDVAVLPTTQTTTLVTTAAAVTTAPAVTDDSVAEKNAALIGIDLASFAHDYPDPMFDAGMDQNRSGRYDFRGNEYLQVDVEDMVLRVIGGYRRSEAGVAEVAAVWVQWTRQVSSDGLELEEVVLGDLIDIPACGVPSPVLVVTPVVDVRAIELTCNDGATPVSLDGLALSVT